MSFRTLVAAALVLAAGIVTLAGCASAPTSAPASAQAPVAKKEKPRKPGFPYRRLRPPVAYEMMRDTPDMLILDLRQATEFNGPTGHLRRAQNIPLAELAGRLGELEVFRDDTFLVYCQDDPCAQAGLDLLREKGFDGAVLLQGGIDAWIRSGFRTVLPAGVVGRPGHRRPPPQVDAAGMLLRPLRPGEKPVPPPDDVPQIPPPLR